MQSTDEFNPTIHPAGEAVPAGPWTLTLQRAELGNDAFSTMAAANPANRETPMDLQWVIAWITATNTSDQPHVINVSDFSACGAEGVLYQSPITDGPHPLLQGTVEPGATLEGAVPFWVGDLSNVLLRFSSPFLGGSWADAWFGITDGAFIPTYEPVAEASGAGTNPASPAVFGETVRAGDFDVSILRYVTGQGLFDISPPGTRALGAYDTGNWHGFLVNVRNVSDKPRFFSFVALRIADANGEPWDHSLALSAPAPDVARELLPGATMEGWASINTQPWASLNLVRVQNSEIEGNARFFTFGSGTPVELPDPVLDLNPGDVVAITIVPLNLRAEPSISGDIVTELDGSSTLTITGEPVDSDDYIWWPVAVDTTGETGFVASNYLELATVD